MKKIITIAAGLCLSSFLFAQGGITEEMMSKIKQGYSGTMEEKALMNAISHSDINTLALNLENEGKMDTHFSNKVNTKGITDQESSGRCWLFSGLNVLRAKTIAEHNLGDFHFSHNYISFYDQLEKSNLFLQGIIDTRTKDIRDRKVAWLFRHAIGDGGQFTGVQDLVEKYGLVPSNVMPETNSSNNTKAFASLMTKKLQEYGLELRRLAGSKDGFEAAPVLKRAKLSEMEEKLEARKTEMLSFLYRFLVLNFGVPPTEFTWTCYNASGEAVSTKEYTPKSFYDEFVGKKLVDNYVLLMNDPTREFYKTYEIDMDRHSYDGENWIYINLPIQEIKDMAIASIKDSTMMYFSCDVGKFLNRKKGFLDVNYYDYDDLMGEKFSMNKKERIITGASGSSHAMTLMAVDLDENGVAKKWEVENSWGDYGFNGHLIMTDEWFNEYMFRLVVEKKYVPSKVLKLLDEKPTMLPPWDPMFKSEL